MSARTFYLAASSDMQTEAFAAMCAMTTAGLINLMDWTDELDAPKERWPLLASCDTFAAISADVFVMLAEPVSPGAMWEAGARVGTGSHVHLVGDPSHLFMRHPLVIVHDDWSAFLAALREGRVQ